MSATPRLATLVGQLSPERPAYAALAERLRLLIIDGRLPPGTRLPSERELTAMLGVSRTTVTRAYDLLREKGYAASRRGSGTLARLPDGRRQLGTGVLMRGELTEGIVDLTCAATRAPVGTAEAYQWAAERLPAYLAGAGYFSAGLPELRSAIAARYTARGLPTEPEHILVTSGAVAGVAIVAGAFLRTGSRVVVETPSYPNSVELLRRSGIRLMPTPVDETGWDLRTTSADIRRAGAAAALLLPDHQNPTGAYLPDAQRAELAAVLRREEVLAIIDETVAEVALDHAADALPFAAHHRGAILIGSASKTYWGGLRTGWIRAPRARVMDLMSARATVDLCAPVMEQLVTLRLMEASGGTLAAETRADLSAGREATIAAVRRHFPHWRFTTPVGGLSLWIDLGEQHAGQLAYAAEQAGVLLATGSRFAVRGRLDHRLRLPYVLPAAEMTAAIERLAAAEAAAAEAPYAPGAPGCGDPDGASPSGPRGPRGPGSPARPTEPTRQPPLVA